MDESHECKRSQTHNSTDYMIQFIKTGKTDLGCGGQDKGYLWGGGGIVYEPGTGRFPVVLTWVIHLLELFLDNGFWNL